jgi:hypothetical protein
MRRLTTRELPPRWRFFFTRVFPAVFIVAGALLAAYGLRNLYLAFQSLSWPSAEAVIEQSSVDFHRGQHHRNGRSSAGTYHARIIYAFQVEGVEYQGTRVTFGDYGSSTPFHAREVANRFPMGKQVKAYYSPKNPRHCVLEPGVDWATWLHPAIGLLFLAAGIAMAGYLPQVLTAEKPAGEAKGAPAAKAALRIQEPGRPQPRRGPPFGKTGE